jgi:NTP pyrophosphatase (non-canonical NTP hydrolase)
VDRFQREVGQWADRAFPRSSIRTIAAHFEDEAEEFVVAAEAVRFFPLDASVGDADEAADCLLLLLHYAHKRGFSLFDAAREKHAANRGRRWGNPEERGVVKHVAEQTGPTASTEEVTP